MKVGIGLSAVWPLELMPITSTDSPVKGRGSKMLARKYQSLGPTLVYSLAMYLTM
jgi:hypothetical protein